MNHQKNKVQTYTVTVLCLCLLAVLLRTVSYLFFFDTDPGYFKISPLPIITNVLCVLTVLWALTPLVLIPKDTLTKAEVPTVAAPTVPLLCVAALVITAVAFLISYVKTPAVTKLVVSATALLSVPFFVTPSKAEGTNDASGRTGLRLLSSYILIIFFAALLVHTYMDYYVPMNSPFKTSLHFALLSAMLGILQSARRLIGGDKIAPRADFVSMLLGTFLTGIFSLPTLVALAAGKFARTDYLLYALVTFAFFLFFLARLIPLTSVLSGADAPATPEEARGGEH